MEPTIFRLVAQCFNQLRYMTLSICASQKDCYIASFLCHFKVRMLPLHDTRSCTLLQVFIYLSKKMPWTANSAVLPLFLLARTAYQLQRDLYDFRKSVRDLRIVCCTVTERQKPC
jgi:hypothetical protein